MKIRKNTYFGQKKKDQEIFQYIQSHLSVDNYSNLSKELMYDGIQYRKLQNTPPTNVTHSHTFPNKSNSNPNLSNVKLNKKSLKKDDAISKLDMF